MPEASTVRRMFEGVAPRYDLLNRVLSLGADRSWRRSVVAGLGLSPDARVLDLCCGTGDLALEIAPRAECVACDFTWNMLRRARSKADDRGLDVHLAAADALALPFASDAFDAATVAFGVRNLEDLDAGLEEVLRVLKPGGTLAVLEFSHPRALWLRAPYRFYLNVVLPRIGELLSRRGSAYRYLADSIMGFPDPETLVRLLEDAGYEDVTYRPLSGGIVAVHRASKPPAAAGVRSGAQEPASRV